MQSLFVSSTFKDMQGERDALHRLVIPRLREKARAYGENIQFVDLRWGISTTDMDSDDGAGKILEVCLDEIRQCKPCMIVLLGERYGWMPSPALLQGSAEEKNFSLESYEMSVTELEIQYGLYLAQGQIDRCVFCLREELPSDTLPEELRDIYVADSDADRQRMRRLREKIRNTPGATVIHYHLDWDGEKQDFAGYDAFADTLTDTLEKALSGNWKQRQGLSWQERQREEDALVIDRHQTSFVGRDREVKEIMEAIDAHQVVILEGEGGCGKSALMAQLLKQKQKQGVAAAMFCSGNSNHCMSTQQLIKLMWWQLDRFAGQGHFEELTEGTDFRELFNSRMAKYLGPDVVFFIDAIDQLSPDRGLYESWFIPPVISERIKIVISTTGVVRVNPMALPAGKKGVSSQIIRLTPPEGESLRQILTARFLTEHKQVSRKVADKILENPCSKNMLGMEIMVRRLVMLGKEDFQKIAELEKTMDGNEAIDTYLLRLIEEMPKNLHFLIIDYMDTVCKFLDEAHFQSMQLPQYFIALMQHGFSADQTERLAEFIKTDSGYRSIPEDNIWRHFWDPILFARMKRYLGTLVVQRMDGRVDYAHRLLREALLSREGVDNIGQVVRYWLFFEPREDITRLENILILSRFYEDSEMRAEKDYESDPALIKTFVQDPISTAGNLEEDPDPEKAAEGKRQMEILQRSILNDLGGEDGWKHLNTYCTMLDSVIKDGEGPNYYMIWFFGVELCAVLEKQGEQEKTMALQILCRLIASLHEQKKAYDAGKEEYADNWTNQRKRRMLLYYTRAMRLLADLWQSLRMGIVKVGKAYGVDEDDIFQQGIALAEECIAEEPDMVIYHIRKAQLYSDYAAISKDIRVGRKSNKQTHLVEQAMACIERALACTRNMDREKMISQQSFCIYVIARCVKVMTEVYDTQLFGRKVILDTAEQYFQKAWDIVENSGYGEELGIADVAKLLIAWDRCCYQNTWAHWKKSAQYRQLAVDRQFDYYHNIRGRDRTLIPEDREALAIMAVNICSLMMQGNLPKSMKDKGCSRRSLLRDLIEKEGGYLQAQARSDFASRWRWAQMLCAEVLYHYDVNPQQCLETGERVLPLLEELLVEQKKSYCLDVTESEITSKRNFMRKLLNEMKEKLGQTVKA